MPSLVPPLSALRRVESERTVVHEQQVSDDSYAGKKTNWNNVEYRALLSDGTHRNSHRSDFTRSSKQPNHETILVNESGHVNYVIDETNEIARLYQPAPALLNNAVLLCATKAIEVDTAELVHCK